MKWFLKALGSAHKVVTSSGKERTPQIPFADLADLVQRLQLVTRMLQDEKNSGRAVDDIFNDLCGQGLEVNRYLNDHIVKIHQGMVNLNNTTALSRDMKHAESWIRAVNKYINSMGDKA